MKWTPAFFVTACVVCIVGQTGLARADNDELVVFNDANALYKDGDYEGAIELYNKLLDDGVVDKDLFFNLANASYKIHDLGRAVLFYEKTLRLAPRESDARENLDLVRSQLRDKQFVEQQNRLVAFAVVLHSRLSTTEMFVLASLSYVILCLLGIVYIFRESLRLRSFYRRVSLVSPGRLMGLSFGQDILLAMAVACVVFVTAGVSTYAKVGEELHRSEAVVLAKEISVVSSPTDDATLQFKIHEGTKVVISDQRGGWYRIQLPGGLSGWVTQTAVARV